MLQELRETNGLSQQQLADALSAMGARWTQADVSRIETGKIRPTIDRIRQAADYFGVTQGTLLGEKENKESIRKILQPRVEQRIAESFGPTSVPILGHANGSSEAVMLNINEPIGEAPQHPNQKGQKNSFALYARGESMSPRYMQGELVYAIMGQSPLPGADCIIEMMNGEAYLKQYAKSTDKEIICRQLNPAKEWKRPRSEVRAIHRVVGRG